MPEIRFRDLKIDTIDSSSGVFSGDNIHYSWRSSKKINQGNGAVSGNQNSFTEGRYAVFKEKKFGEKSHDRKKTQNAFEQE
ncbi:MAG TPA: hypothetical protein VF199_04845 [Bacillales bacterium]